jgi:PAS domain S-box-containing protein
MANFTDSQKEALLRFLESSRDYAIFILDPSGRVTTWNAGAELIKGYRASEIIGKHFSIFYPPQVLERRWPDYELQAAAEQGRFEDEGWRLRKDGSRFWANVIITALRDIDGQLTGFAKVTRDLTERRAQEESLRQSEEHFRLLVEGVNDYAIFMLDANGYIVTWNSGAQRLNGYTAAEIIGLHFSRFYPPDAIESGWPDHELEVAAEQGRFEDEGWRLRKDGSKFWANVVITALRDADGRLQGFAKVTRDLTAQQRSKALEADNMRREELLEAERSARIEAQRASRIKDEFLATLSHELRTPLNAILGWTQVLKAQRPPQRDYLERAMETIERNARAQVRLIDELLDLSRIVQGRVRLDVQRVTLPDVIDAACESIQPAAHAKRIRLEKIVDPLAGLVSGDPARLQQVLWNLLTNAIKFTPKGGRVQVVLQRVNSHIELSVNDTGIGIAPDFLPYVFDRFSQKESVAGRSHGGLGLGLAIAKHLVELHGGSIRAKSPGEGNGATFIVDLPLAIVRVEDERIDRIHPTHAPDIESQPRLPNLAGVKALLVEDEADSRELIQQVLEAQGAAVTAVASGAEALEILHAGEYDVMLSDIGMPGMDGYHLMRRVRTGDNRYRSVPAIAITAFARPEDRRKALLAGYQLHIAKPLDIAELVIVVAGLVGRTAEQ